MPPSTPPPFKAVSPSAPMAGTNLLRWPVVKDVLLIFHPIAAWNRIAIESRSVAFIFFVYFLPVLLLASAAEGMGLMIQARRHISAHATHQLTVSKILVCELLEAGVLLALILICAAFIKMFGNTCHNRNRLSQSLALLLHALGPLLLVRTLNAIPGLNPWLPWLAGMALALGTLYHGLPRIMQPDGPSALGLFLGSAFVIFTLLFLGQMFACWFLFQQFRPVQNLLSVFTMKIF